MSGSTRAEKLFLAIGGVEDRLVDQAASPGGVRRRPARARWAVLAAAVAVVAGVGLVRLLPIGGAGNGGLGIGGNGAAPGDTPEATVFMSYAGALLPLTVVEGPEGLPADREVTLDFSQAEDAAAYSLYRTEITDTTTIHNPEEQTLTVTVGYPVTASLREEELLPTLTVDGRETETGLLWGEGRQSGGNSPQWTPRLSGWEALKELLAGGDCLAGAMEEPPALDYTVTVWELLDETAPETQGRDMAPTLAVDFRPGEDTRVWTWGFNGYSLREDGTARYDFFVREEGERKQRRLLVFLGDAPAEYTMAGYENGGCEKELPGVAARMTAFTTTLGELLDRLAEEEFSLWDSAGGAKDRIADLQAGLRRMMDRLAGSRSDEGGVRMLEELFSHVATSTRVVWTTAEVTIPAGGTATVTARYQKPPSFDFACANTRRRGLLGWDLGTSLGSSLKFLTITARLENAGNIRLEGQNFGFDPENGVTRVELDPEEPYYYMEVRVKGEPE